MTTQQQAWDAEAALREPDTTSASTSTATSTELNETPASTTQVEQTPAAAAPAAQPDPLEELRKNYLQLQQSQTELLQRLASTESVAKAAVGRVSAWQSEQDAARTAAARTAAEAPSKAAIAAATTPEKWNTLKSEFPEWGEAIESFVESRFSSVPQGQQGLTEEQIDAKLKSLPANSPEIDIETRKDLVESIIPGWEQKVNAPAFAPWMEAQPAEVKALAASVKVSDAVKLVRLFEKHEASQAQAIEAQRQETLRNAAGGRPNASSRTDVDPGNLSPEAIWNQEATAREKQRRG